jgi:hypothetical protein
MLIPASFNGALERLKGTLNLLVVILLLGLGQHLEVYTVLFADAIYDACLLCGIGR